MSQGSRTFYFITGGCRLCLFLEPKPLYNANGMNSSKPKTSLRKSTVFDMLIHIWQSVTNISMKYKKEQIPVF